MAKGGKRDGAGRPKFYSEAKKQKNLRLTQVLLTLIQQDYEEYIENYPFSKKVSFDEYVEHVLRNTMQKTHRHFLPLAKGANFVTNEDEVEKGKEPIYWF